MVGDQIKLTEPEAKNWFQTVSQQNKNLALNSLISDFTQPSWLSTEKMVALVIKWIEKKSVKKVLEFGPGIGPFTLAFLSEGFAVDTFENNSKAIEVLQANAKDHQLEALLKMNPANSSNSDLVFVNPPRSGLQGFVQNVIQSQAKICIYISCFPQSMAVDLSTLKKSGYQIKNVTIVDQFPQTKHYESCVLLEKSS